MFVEPGGPTPTPEPYDLQDHWLRSLVVAPGENGRLYGVTNEGYLLTSRDRGGAWLALNLPIGDDGKPALASAIGMDYNHPETLYLSTSLSSGIWRSTDGGKTWEKRSSGYFGAVTVDLDDSNVLWSGNPAPVRSTDGGATWWPANEGFDHNLLSPVVIDPQAHDLRYAVSQSKGGGGALYRRTDDNIMWDKVNGAPVGGWPDGYAGPGLALDGDTRALYLGNPNGTLYVSPNPYELTKTDIVWTPIKAFAYQPIPLAVGGSPADGALYITLNNYARSTLGRTLRSDDGGATWTALTIPAPSGAATPTATSTSTRSPTPPATHTQTPTPTSTPTATRTATPTVTPAPLACYEGLINGGFETDAGWLIKSNPVLAGYGTTPVHSGSRSMRTGIAAGGANTPSYSPIEQAVTFPSGLASATLYASGVTTSTAT